MLAQSLYSPKDLHGKNGNEMQEMCWQKGHNWNDLHCSKKRGTFILKYGPYDDSNRTFWKASDETPEFSTNKIMETLI